MIVFYQRAMLWLLRIEILLVSEWQPVPRHHQETACVGTPPSVGNLIVKLKCEVLQHTQTPAVKGTIKFARKLRVWLELWAGLMVVPADNFTSPLSLMLQSSDWKSSDTDCCGNSRSLFNDEQRTEKSIKHNSEKSWVNSTLKQCRLTMINRFSLIQYQCNNSFCTEHM